MRVYRLEEIKKFRDSFIDLKYREHDVKLGGKEFSFFDIPQDRNPAFECFALVMAGRKGDDYVIGVSNHVETAFRPLWAFHEFIEAVEPGADRSTQCIDALKNELDVAGIVLETERDLPRYLTARKRFFGQLFDYALGHPGIYSKEKMHEFRQSLDYLVSRG
jgi:hypothetical protein